ncbi:MAG: triose-phosphate isomerase [Patescibacteria group bacterium]
MKKLYLFANWKMYLDAAESEKLAREFEEISYPKRSKVVVFPSALVIEELVPIFKKTKISFGAQNTYWADKGAYSGEISAAMYRDVGCSYALVGHAERRHKFHESDEDTRLKMEAILKLKMTPVLCVGETEEERKNNKTEEVLERQLSVAYRGLVWPKGIELLIAYEPVWAIGTGESCSPTEAERVCSLVSGWTRKFLGVEPAILYGGSVAAENISDYVSQSHIQGVLVGGASAKKASWVSLIKKLS